TEAHGARSYHGAPRLTARSSLRHRAGVRPDEIRVELARPEDADTAALAACEALLSDEERARASRLRSESARGRHVVARALLRRALGRGRGVPPAAFPLR